MTPIDVSAMGHEVGRRGGLMPYHYDGHWWVNCKHGERTGPYATYEDACRAARELVEAYGRCPSPYSSSDLEGTAVSRRSYRTLVVDPPWPIGAIPKRPPYEGPRRSGETALGTRPLPYRTMSVDAMADLPVGQLVGPQAHLYLWTVNAFLTDAYAVANAWGFRVRKPLVWTKKPMGFGLGGTFTNTTEFFLFCTRGRIDAKCKIDTTWFAWPRCDSHNGGHSAKPDAFYDLVERVSVGPYVELFARRARLGWDYWGDESLGTAEMVA